MISGKNCSIGKLLLTAVFLLVGLTPVMAAGIPTGEGFETPPVIGDGSYDAALTSAGSDGTIKGSIILALQQYIDFFLMFVGAILLIVVIYGGWTYLTAGGDAEKAKGGSKAIAMAVMGVIIIGLSYAFSRWILSGLIDVCQEGVHSCTTTDDCAWMEEQCAQYSGDNWYCRPPLGGGSEKYCYTTGGI